MTKSPLMLSLMTPLGPKTDGLLRQGAINRDMYLRYVSRFFISARSARKLLWKEGGHALKGLYRAL